MIVRRLIAKKNLAAAAQVVKCAPSRGRKRELADAWFSEVAKQPACVESAAHAVTMLGTVGSRRVAEANQIVEKGIRSGAKRGDVDGVQAVVDAMKATGFRLQPALGRALHAVSNLIVDAPDDRTAVRAYEMSMDLAELRKDWDVDTYDHFLMSAYWRDTSKARAVLDHFRRRERGRQLPRQKMHRLILRVLCAYARARMNHQAEVADYIVESTEGLGADACEEEGGAEGEPDITVGEVMAFLGDMRREGVPFSRDVYHTVLKLLSTYCPPDLDAVDAVVGDMVSNGLAPSRETYTTVLLSLINARADGARAELLMREMLASGVQPDAAFFSLILSFYARRADLARFHKVLEHFFDTRHVVSQKVLSIVLSAAPDETLRAELLSILQLVSKERGAPMPAMDGWDVSDAEMWASRQMQGRWGTRADAWREKGA